MKHIYYKTLIIALVLVGVIGMASAADFVNPGTGNNGGVNPPIHTGQDQVKDASLSVGNFLARSIAVFKQSIFFSSEVMGTPLASPRQDGTTPKTVSFGGAKVLVQADPVLGIEEEFEQYTTAVVASDTIRTTKSLFSGNLFHNFAKPAQTCADSDGNVVKCSSSEEEGEDVCPNITGIQTTVPIITRTKSDGTKVVSAMFKDDNGDCQFANKIPTADDWCPNIPLNQTVFPQYLRGTTIVYDPTSYYEFKTDAERVNTILSGLMQQIQKDTQANTSSESAMNSLTKMRNAVNAAITAMPGQRGAVPGSQIFDALENAYRTINLEALNKNGSSSSFPSEEAYNNYRSLNGFLAGEYQKTAPSLVPSSWDGSYNCMPRPTLTKVTFTTSGAFSTLRFEFDNALLSDQHIGVRGIERGGFNDGTDVGPIAYLYGRAGGRSVQYTARTTTIKKFTDDTINPQDGFLTFGGPRDPYDLGAWNDEDPDGFCISGAQYLPLVANKPNNTVIIPNLFRYWSTFSNGTFQTMANPTWDSGNHQDTDCMENTSTSPQVFNDANNKKLYLGYQNNGGDENKPWD